MRTPNKPLTCQFFVDIRITLFDRFGDLLLCPFGIPYHIPFLTALYSGLFVKVDLFVGYK